MLWREENNSVVTTENIYGRRDRDTHRTKIIDCCSSWLGKVTAHELIHVAEAWRNTILYAKQECVSCYCMPSQTTFAGEKNYDSLPGFDVSLVL